MSVLESYVRWCWQDRPPALSMTGDLVTAQLRSRLTYANVMATIAVFIALGGTSYALATGAVGSRELKDNGVRSKDIRNNDVRGKDVRSGAIRSGDVANFSLRARDFAPNQLPAGPKGDPGPQGAAGPQGPKGETGQAGPTAVGVGNVTDPLATPDGTMSVGATSLVTPSAGSVFAFGQLTLGMNCPSGTFNCSFVAGLYIDGTPIPDSGQSRTVPVGTTQLYDFDLFGVARDVPAGTHTITVGWKATSPNPAVWASQSAFRSGGIFAGGG
jgi:hypothetical protein